MSAEKIALMFHEIYEREAPIFGYETRDETRTFDPESANGKLMIAVCGQMIEQLGKNNERFFRAGFSQGYGSQVADVDRVDELYEMTKEAIESH